MPFAPAFTNPGTGVIVIHERGSRTWHITTEWLFNHDLNEHTLCQTRLDPDVFWATGKMLQHADSLALRTPVWCVDCLLELFP